MKFNDRFVVELKFQMKKLQGNFIRENHYLHKIKNENKAAFVEKDRVIRILQRNLFPYQTEVVKTFLYHEENIHTSCETLNLADVLIKTENEWEPFHIYTLPEYFYTTKRKLDKQGFRVANILPSTHPKFLYHQLDLAVKPEVLAYKRSVYPILKPVMYKDYLLGLSNEIEPLEGFNNLIECLLYLNWIFSYEDKYLLNQEI